MIAKDHNNPGIFRWGLCWTTKRKWFLWISYWIEKVQCILKSGQNNALNSRMEVSNVEFVILQDILISLISASLPMSKTDWRVWIRKCPLSILFSVRKILCFLGKMFLFLDVLHNFQCVCLQKQGNYAFKKLLRIISQKMRHFWFS